MAHQQLFPVWKLHEHPMMSHRDCQKISRKKHAHGPCSSRGGLRQAGFEKSSAYLRSRIFTNPNEFCQNQFYFRHTSWPGFSLWLDHFDKYLSSWEGAFLPEPLSLWQPSFSSQLFSSTHRLFCFFVTAVKASVPESGRGA
jgi:hypothetical protein